MYLSTLNQKDAWKKLKLPKVGRGCPKLRFFLWLTHWWSHFCETDWLGVGKDVKEILRFYKNELRVWFHCYISIPRKCLRKTLFQHTMPLQILCRLITPMSNREQNSPPRFSDHPTVLNIIQVDILCNTKETNHKLCNRKKSECHKDCSTFLLKKRISE